MPAVPASVSRRCRTAPRFVGQNVRAHENVLSSVRKSQSGRRTSRRGRGIEAAIGSSRNTISGSLMSACASPTRCNILLKACAVGGPALLIEIHARQQFSARRFRVAESSPNSCRCSRGTHAGQVIVEVRILREMPIVVHRDVADVWPRMLPAGVGKISRISNFNVVVFRRRSAARSRKFDADSTFNDKRPARALCVCARSRIRNLSSDFRFQRSA